MPHILIDLTGVANLDISTATRVQLPGAKQPHFGEETALRASLGLYSHTHRPGTGLIRDILRLQDASVLRVTVVGSVRGTTAPSSSVDFTLTLGEFISATVYGLHSGGGGGFYFWWHPKEIGIYGGGSIGAAINIASFGGGTQFGILFGPAPVALSGISLVIGVDISVKPAAPISVGGFLVFSTSLEFRGIGWSIGAGEGAFPIEISASISATATKALGHI